METITGTLKVKGAKVQVSEKFSKLEFVVTDNSSQYPQHISIQLMNDKCGIIDKFNVGDEVKVSINLQGREWTSPQGEVKYFNTITAWKIESAGGTATATNQTSITDAAPETFAGGGQGGDDLPF